MRLLVTGATGQIGTEVVELATAAGHDVIAVGHRRGPHRVDLADGAAIDRLLRTHEPEVIVHAAAWTDVDGCELDPERAMAINGRAVERMAAAARTIGARIVLVSTDYVFDGTADAYREDSPPAPLSAYGRSKLVAERAMGDQDAIVRTSWVCGFHGRNVVRTVLGLARRRTPMRFVDDQIGRPTFVRDLAPALLHVATSGATGTFHATNATTLSWHGFVRAILTSGGFDPDLVDPIRTDELDPPRPAPRPARSVLVGDRLVESGHPPLPPMDGSLDRLVTRLLTESPDL